MAHADRVVRTSFLLALLLAGSSAGATENYRSVVIFGDTQRLVTDGQFGGRFYFERMVEWVMDETNREAENIDFVLHVGDVIQSAIPCNALEPDEQSMASCEGNMPAIQTQWATFDEIWAPISDSDLPFAIVRGCHDNANTFPGFVGSFDQNYGREKFEGFSSQWSNAEVLATCDGETLPENDPQGVCPATNDTGHVWKFRLGGPFPQDVLVAGMPDKPSYELQAWYRFILEREAGIPSILLNHASLSRNQGSAFRNLVEGPFSTRGPLADRVFMTAMGHLSYDIKDIIDIDGFQVLRVLFDRQGENLPAGAGIALIRFYIDANGIHRVEGKTIEPNIFGVPGFVASGDFGPVPFAVDGDIDNDGLIDAQDNCDVVVNPAQADLDADGVGDDCESDIDGDLIPDSVDPDVEVVLNCEIEEQAMTVPNYCDGDLVAPIGVVDSADQAALLACLDLGNAPGCAKADMNEDGSWDRTDYVIFGRVCAGACVDLDVDGVPDDVDNCVSIENPNQGDADGDGIGDLCDNCQLEANGPGDAENQLDNSATPTIVGIPATGFGNVCVDAGGPSAFASSIIKTEPHGLGDTDGDGIPNLRDNCHRIPNPEQVDEDNDGFGYRCQALASHPFFEPSGLLCAGAVGNCPPVDADGDRIPDDLDNCPTVPNFVVEDGAGGWAQPDEDGDGVGDACDNCTLVPNGPLAGSCSEQQDADLDGYGNACDTDFNNNGATDAVDLGQMLTASQSVSTNPVYDLNCNGAADLQDLSQTLSDYQGVQQPGPSGLECAGTVPCEAPPVVDPTDLNDSNALINVPSFGPLGRIILVALLMGAGLGMRRWD